jgi:hypothetical protein
MNNGTTPPLIHPEIRGIHSPDLEPPKLPDDPFDCEVFFQALIGPREGKGHESFQFSVITPVRLAKLPEGMWGRGRLIMPAFEWAAVAQALAKLLAQAVRPTWNEVTAELNKELLWESSTERNGAS